MFPEPAAGHTDSALIATSLHEIFHSTPFLVARNLTIFFAVVFWLGLAYWTQRDARRRIDDGWLVAIASLIGLVPILGPLVYLVFRPPETLEEVHARRVEVQTLEARLYRREPQCPVCRSVIQPDFLICPVCTTHLKKACAACKAPLEPLWQACPYCTTPVGVVPADLDAALTAEVVSTGTKKAPGRQSRRTAAS